jgi:K+-sensing histidine kinase KdpD
VRIPTTRVHETIQFLLGVVLLAVLTALCFWLEFRLVSAAFAYLILIVLLSLWTDLIAVAALSFAAVGCLNYFFAAPIFSLHVEAQEDILTVTGFLITSVVVTGLMTRMRTAQQEQMLATERLRDAQLGLAHVNRVATVGQLTSSIAHEVKHPCLGQQGAAAGRYFRCQ